MLVLRLALVSLALFSSTPFAYSAEDNKKFEGRFNSVSCAGSGATALCVGSGFHHINGTPKNLLVQSNNGGENWAVIKNIYRLPQNQSMSFLTSSCVGEKEKATCMAAGYWLEEKATRPLIVRTIDKGQTWVTQTIDGVSSGLFKKMSCTGKLPNTFCIAAGWKRNYQGPILAQTTNGGKTWQRVSIPEFPDTGILSVASCTGSGSQALCVAAGEGKSKAILVQSRDGGKTWMRQPLDLPAIDFDFVDAHCAGEGANAICTLVGEIRPNWDQTLPLLVQTTNGGATWSTKMIEGFADDWDGILKGVYCVKENDRAFCLAVGSKNDKTTKTDHQPLIVQSIDGGQHWSVKPIHISFGQGPNVLNAISCTHNQPKLYCIAVGSEDVKELPLILQTRNAGEKWSKHMVTHFTGVLRAASCTGKGSRSVCAATGYFSSDSVNLPLLARTLDRGNHWRLETVTQ